MVHRALLLVSIFLFSCSSQIKPKWFNASAIQLQNRADIVYEGDQPFTGAVYYLAENGKDTIAVGEFLNGKENGAWRKFYSNGKIAEQRFYDRGIKTGILTEWWDNGNKKIEYHFANGEYEGVCKQWNRKGALVSDMHYSKGYEAGVQAKYYDNGKMKSNYVMKDGRRYGLLGTKNCVNVSDSIFKN